MVHNFWLLVDLPVATILGRYDTSALRYLGSLIRYPIPFSAKAFLKLSQAIKNEFQQATKNHEKYI